LHLATLTVRGAACPSRCLPACRYDMGAMMRGEELDDFIDALILASEEEELKHLEGAAGGSGGGGGA